MRRNRGQTSLKRKRRAEGLTVKRRHRSTHTDRLT